ncbi:hypothetical protein [Eoetvoesiella caeni]|uniref:Uncharacterized protein n=1 Tax=Eoetvoesiella caeni TaxID=645616 RepID=A0A366H163_9BURK|nr:hypothetical protein [Eoetvoesiella caeni]MCI2811018.1 hypothetical protein [Eoetvoesiella caeni]NYT56918.1 hypothetical protein [Eoetvoesiella caeni]RBP35242.1 hypothetical protein DFR37_11816 [Eoetvoesiella caeni]
MKQDTLDREKQRVALEHNSRQAQAKDDRQAAKDQEFYTRLGLTDPDTDTLEDTFVISIHCEHWTHQELEAGEANTRETELDYVTVGADDLVRHSRNYGLSEPSCTDPKMSPDIWFRSTYPREDRTYFEQGVQKYYSLHVHDVNGHPPEPADYQRIANLLNVRFDHQAFQLQEAKQEGPDLCL